jgi:hypothetical protein
MLDELKKSENGVFECYGENHNGTHKSCIWKVPYAKIIDTTTQHRFDAPRVKYCGKHNDHVS